MTYPTSYSEDSLEYVRQYYKLPAYIGQRVRYRKDYVGTITGGAGAYIKITFDGTDKEDIGRYHPDWEIEYLEAEE